MKRLIIYSSVIILVGIAALGGVALLMANDESPTNADYQWTKIVDGYERPLYVTHAGDGRLFVVEQRGVISMISPEGNRLEPIFLDIEDRVRDASNEQGLLSVAFDPDFADSGTFFVNYTREPDGATVVSRFSVDANGLGDADSETLVLTIEQPYGNHNGGLIKFGADGYLYIGTGDGGSGGDPQNFAQNPQSLLGKMLRIDVSELPYTIPDDNPFVDDPTFRGEIWALGLRNPWRWSFDRTTGDLYIGDVGQSAIEEVSVLLASDDAGQNLGWRHFEGNQEYDQSQPLATEPVTAPVFTYTHDSTFGFVEQNILRSAHCSVTGGYVYRGESLPDLQGVYLFGDYCSGTMWTMQRDDTNTWVVDGFMGTDFTISSFGEDVNGELYLTSFSGEIWKLEKLSTG